MAASIIRCLFITIIVTTQKGHGQVFIGDATTPGILYAYPSGNDDNLLNENFTLITLSAGNTPEYLDYDEQEQRVYWGQFYGERIGRVFLNGSSEEIVVPNAGNVGSISLDTTNRYIYWTGYNSASVYRSKMDGSSRETLYTHSTSGQPISIAVDSINEFLFWTPRLQSRFVRAPLDASDPQTISTVVMPTGVDLVRCPEISEPIILYIGNTERSGSRTGELGIMSSDGQSVKPLYSFETSIYTVSLMRSGALFFWVALDSCCIVVYDNANSSVVASDINKVNTTDGNYLTIAPSFLLNIPVPKPTANIIKNCPPSIVRILPENTTENQITVEWEEPSVSDPICYELELMGAGTNGGNFSIGRTDLSYVSTDRSGNTTSCSFHVAVLSAASATPVCPDDIRVGLSPGASSEQVSWTLPANNDTAVLPLNITGGQSGDFFEPGSTKVIVFREGYPELQCIFTVTVVVSKSEPSNLPVIIGCSVAGAVVLLIIIVLCLCCCTARGRTVFGIKKSEPAAKWQPVGGVAKDPGTRSQSTEEDAANVRMMDIQH